MARLELSAHMTVRPGCLEGFKKQAAELIRYSWWQPRRQNSLCNPGGGSTGRWWGRGFPVSQGGLP